MPDDSRFYEQSEDKIGGFGGFIARILPYRNLLIQAIAINFATIRIMVRRLA